MCNKQPLVPNSFRIRRLRAEGVEARTRLGVLLWGGLPGPPPPSQTEVSRPKGDDSRGVPQGPLQCRRRTSRKRTGKRKTRRGEKWVGGRSQEAREAGRMAGLRPVLSLRARGRRPIPPPRGRGSALGPKAQSIHPGVHLKAGARELSQGPRTPPGPPTTPRRPLRGSGPDPCPTARTGQGWGPRGGHSAGSGGGRHPPLLPWGLRALGWPGCNPSCVSAPPGTKTPPAACPPLLSKPTPLVRVPGARAWQLLAGAGVRRQSQAGGLEGQTSHLLAESAH